MSKVTQKEIISYITPAAGFFLVEELDDEATAFSIAGNDKKPQRAKVLRVGGVAYFEHFERELLPPAEIGDIIIHSAFGYEDITIKGIKYRLVPFTKVIAVISGEDYEKIQ